MDLVRLDMSRDDEAGIVLRLDQEIPALALAGARHVLVDLGDRPAIRGRTADAITQAHRELRAIGARLVVVGTPKAAHRCCRECPELLVAATTRQAHDALGLRAM